MKSTILFCMCCIPNNTGMKTFIGMKFKSCGKTISLENTAYYLIEKYTNKNGLYEN